MRRTAALLAAVMVAAGCTTGAREAAPYEGMWESVGYGFYLVIEGGSADVYEHTRVSCVRISSGPTRGISEIVTLRDDGTLVLEERGRIIPFVDLDVLPEGCLDAPDPGDTLAVAVASIEEHHPSLGERDPDWAARRDAMLPGGQTESTEILAALQELLAPLADPQVRLAVDDEAVLPGGSWSAVPFPEETPIAAVRQGRPDLSEAEGLVWGRLREGPAYLGIARLGGSAGDPDESERNLAAALDRALAAMDGVSAVIVDLRSLRDGTDSAALLVASRFVPRETTIGMRAVRVGDRGEFSEPRPIAVRPMPTGTFPGRVVVLVGPGTVGPGELLALALESVPGVILLGQPTAGSPSPILVRSLPNGWSLGLPHQRVWDPAGRLLELTGLQPDVVVDSSEADRQLEEALVLAGG